MDFNYIENFNKMKEKYSKNTLLDLSKEKLTFEEVVTIHTFIERDSHHSGDFDVSDKCRINGTSSNLSKRLKELRNE